MANLLKKFVFVVVLLAAMPLEAQQSSIDPAIAGKTWNRYTVDNFVILSLDRRQGEFLRRDLPRIKQWSISRWGLPDYSYQTECRIQVVPDKELMQKLFQLNDTHIEIQLDQAGREKNRVVWLLLDGNAAESLPAALLRFSLADFERMNNVKFGLWAYRGMAVLNMTLPQIRARFSTLSSRIAKDNKMFFSKTIFTMDRVKFEKYDAATKELFDTEAAIVCLMLRKEFGQKNFHKLLMAGGSDGALRDVLGFENYASFDIVFKRYMTNLSNDVITNKTPDHYLEIVPAYQPVEARRK